MAHRFILLAAFAFAMAAGEADSDSLLLLRRRRLSDNSQVLKELGVEIPNQGKRSSPISQVTFFLLRTFIINSPFGDEKNVRILFVRILGSTYKKVTKKENR